MQETLTMKMNHTKSATTIF